jgi:hypothetical protein
MRDKVAAQNVPMSGLVRRQGIAATGLALANFGVSARRAASQLVQSFRSCSVASQIALIQADRCRVDKAFSRNRVIVLAASFCKA